MDAMEYIRQEFPHISFRKDWNISSDTAYKLGECHAIVKSLAYLPVDKNMNRQLLNVSLIKGAAATTAIEGNTLSEQEVKGILEGRSDVPPSRKYQETEVRNVIDALNGIFEEVVTRDHVSNITPEFICNFNRQIGKDLGEMYDGVPGRLRERGVQVGRYHAPNHEYVRELLARMCDWLATEFHFDPKREPEFRDAVVEAVAAHLYLVWIHPFNDGNGRTARLLEFYILLRAGLPKICSHILSNFYNQTRDMYYKKIEEATARWDFTGFLEYAVQGFLDGLESVLWQVQMAQLRNAWKVHTRDTLSTKRLLDSRKQRLQTVLDFFSVGTKYVPKDLTDKSPEIAATYARLSSTALMRDIDDLEAFGLLMKTEGGGYEADIRELVMQLPAKRRTPQEQN
ncbi:MAG: Fic family protein [Lentisphaeria bacterium]|nr:Fic family protein [Lentisphaeria bacterium]